MIPRILSLAIALSLFHLPAIGQENLLTNGDFEKGTVGWADFWSRTRDGLRALDERIRHQGRQAMRIEHKGTRDWSFGLQNRLPVRPGEIYELTGWVRVQGKGTATLGVILYDARGEAIDWVYGGITAHGQDNWQSLHSRFVIPPEGATILPRLMGDGPVTAWLDDVWLRRTGNLDSLRASNLRSEVSLENDLLEVRFQTDTATFQVTDRRTGEVYRQHDRGATLFVLDARQTDTLLELHLLDAATMLRLTARVQLLTSARPTVVWPPTKTHSQDNATTQSGSDAQSAKGNKLLPEMLVEIEASGAQTAPIRFPRPFISKSGSYLIMPVNEGISYPVDDTALPEMHYHLYGGHGLCMGWWGVTNGERGLMAIVQTPDDAAVGAPRIDGRLTLQPEWIPQKGHFGPTRRIRYVFFERDGYVAMCKRYRDYARSEGRLVTLAQKRQVNPNVDRLIGAVNVWCWLPNAPEICRRLQSLGIDRILWSRRAGPTEIKQLNQMGVLSSRYDIYQDVMNPEHFEKIGYQHPDWTTAAWPDDLMIDHDDNWMRGWQVTAKDGSRIPCGLLCDRRAVDYARKRIAADLETHTYGCRFIDTTTASPWRECYDPDHPMTRSESRRFKMELLNVVSGENSLVTGSETGHEAAVPFVHYFEGMLSLGPYRIFEAGRRMIEPILDVPDQVSKFQTGSTYRLPLWELVYHDCVVAQWYWGDYNNKLPALWDRRDLINALYGTPPMFMFDAKIWKENAHRFVQSYKTATPVARATGYHEMLSHEWLSPDHGVQRTRFANGVMVTVNLGNQPYQLDNGNTLAPRKHLVEGMPNVPKAIP